MSKCEKCNQDVPQYPEPGWWQDGEMAAIRKAVYGGLPSEWVVLTDVEQQEWLAMADGIIEDHYRTNPTPRLDAYHAGLAEGRTKAFNEAADMVVFTVTEGYNFPFLRSLHQAMRRRAEHPSPSPSPKGLKSSPAP